MAGFRKKNFFQKKSEPEGRSRDSDSRGKGRFRSDDSGSSRGFSREKFEKPRDRGFGDRESRGFSKTDGKRDFGTKKFKAECDGCGETFDLPFLPTGKKPVYCRNCYNQGEGRESAPRSFSRARPSASAGGDLEEINRKLDKIMRALKIH